MLKGQASKHYYKHCADRNITFNAITNKMRTHFETEQRQDRLIDEWEGLTLAGVVRRNPGKPIIDCFEILSEKLLEL